MQYKEYLRSSHWKEFRKSVYIVTKRCQKCGRKKENTILNIHHINYKCLGKETREDVIVLCQECHHHGHNLERWKKAMKQGKDLMFVKKADKSKDFYNKSEVFRLCDRCGNQHPIFHLYYKESGIKHLAMACPNSKPRTAFIKNEDIDGLPIIERP